MDLIGDILLKTRTGRVADALETSPSITRERASSGKYAIAEVIDVDLMDDEERLEVVATQSGEAFVKDDWGLLIGLCWALPAGIITWIVAFCLL